MSPKIKRLCIFGLIGLLALAIALTVFLNVRAGKFTVLFPQAESTKVQETMQMVRDMGYEVRLNGDGQMEVHSQDYDSIVAAIALENYPKSTLGYEQYEKASGLTATDADKRQYELQQLQDRLQDIIRRYGGVENVAVMLNLPESNVKVWEKSQSKGSASVTLTLDPDVKYSAQQVSAIKWLVATSVKGIEPDDVLVTDARTSLALKGVEEDDPNNLDTMLQRMDLERKYEERYEEKARNVISLVFPPEDIRVSCTVRFDYDKVKREAKTYSPSPNSTNNSGVLQHADMSAASGTSTIAQGVPGEDPNTDVVPQYVNNTTDGGGYSENKSSADYAVSYVLEQIEENPTKFSSATLSVTLRATPDELPDDVRESMVQSVAMATGIDPASVSVSNYALEEQPAEQPTQAGLFDDPRTVMFLGIGLLVFLLLLIIILVLVGKARKRKQQDEVLTAATADVIQLQEEDDAEASVQKELEDRKRQLQESAAKSADEEIADEVRDFAKNNPEITANLLRAWMKEEID